MIRDQKFVGGVFQRENRTVISQSFAIENQVCAAKISVSTQALVGRGAERRAGEVENKVWTVAKQSTKGAGVENSLPAPRLQLLNPFNMNFNIVSLRVAVKHFQFAADSDI